jgi:AraC family transcriptional regulator, exoenzyme S synthesis regulatory protein ExsA
MEQSLVSYNNSRIILSHERQKEVTMDIYPRLHLLTFVREGEFMVKKGNESKIFRQGEMVLCRKFSHATITKFCSRETGRFSSILFAFHEDLMQEAFLQLNISIDHVARQQDNICSIPVNPILSQFICSLAVFLDQGVEMDHNLARLKTQEAIIGILRSGENMASQLFDYSVKSKADLFEYMKYHYLEKKELSQFARESGRSLSAFKRDFQNIWNEPPAKWLRHKRLEHAHKLLSTGRKSSEIYLECGFEDLAHFSRSFKEQYGINPSEMNLSFTDKQI